MVFKNFANAHSTIGSMEDLDDATVEDVQEFFRVYYAPNNAVLVVSGSFETGNSERIDRKIFWLDSRATFAARFGRK
jgi:predicted Zn-dependent peptidase